MIATAAEFWCADAGDLWLYDGLDSTTGHAYRNRITYGAALSIDAVTLDAFESTCPHGDLSMAAPHYRFFDSNQGICACLETSPTDLALAYVELPAEIRKGSYRAFEETVSVPGGTETLQIDVSVAGIEPVVLPAGSFDALKVTHRFTLTLRVNGQVSRGSRELHLWYAKDIGVIQQVLDQPSAAPATGTYVERLAGVSAASTLGGFVDVHLLTAIRMRRHGCRRAASDECTPLHSTTTMRVSLGAPPRHVAIEPQPQ